MTKFALAAAAVLALSGGAFAANNDHNSGDAAMPQSLRTNQFLIDSGTTASLHSDQKLYQTRSTSEVVQQDNIGNPNGR